MRRSGEELSENGVESLLIHFLRRSRSRYVRSSGRERELLHLRRVRLMERLINSSTAQ